MQAERLGDLSSRHGAGQVLLVGQDQKNRVAEPGLADHALELIARLANPVAVIRVDDADDGLRVLVVVAPQRTDLVLSADLIQNQKKIKIKEKKHFFDDFNLT